MDTAWTSSSLLALNTFQSQYTSSPNSSLMQLCSNSTFSSYFQVNMPKSPLLISPTCPPKASLPWLFFPLF